MNSSRYISQVFYPSYYTLCEGCAWRPWIKEGVSVHILNTAYKKNLIAINGLLVHSLYFGEPSMPYNALGRWDSINGWTM